MNSILICASVSADVPGVTDEVRALINLLDHAKLAVSYDEAVDLVSKHTFWGVVFSGHSDDLGFAWGEVSIGVDEIIRLVSLASVQWAFINACSSERFIVSIKAALPHVSVIATRSDIDDAKAERVMRSFLSALSSGSRSIAAAVAKAKLATPETEYIFYPSESRRTVQNDEIEEQTKQRLRDLEQRVFGDHRLGIAGIQENLERLDANISSQRWWSIVNTAATIAMILYEVLRNAR